MRRNRTSSSSSWECSTFLVWGVTVVAVVGSLVVLEGVPVLSPNT